MQGGAHILIVDDHREIRDLVSRALTKEGFRVSSAADGRAMRKILADGRIDLILLDLMLPGEDGLSLCRALRSESNIPIIMLTAKEMCIRDSPQAVRCRREKEIGLLGLMRPALL